GFLEILACRYLRRVSMDRLLAVPSKARRRGKTDTHSRKGRPFAHFLAILLTPCNTNKVKCSPIRTHKPNPAKPAQTPQYPSLILHTPRNNLPNHLCILLLALRSPPPIHLCTLPIQHATRIR